MSLKHFHLAFILICLLFTGGFAAWCFLVPDLPPMFTAMGWISALGGLSLFIYGIRFLKKSKDVII
ncbi:MAG: hypothetical protein AAF491_00890 [Verrucomicrobiota bacterium]